MTDAWPIFRIFFVDSTEVSSAPSGVDDGSVAAADSRDGPLFFRLRSSASEAMLPLGSRTIDPLVEYGSISSMNFSSS
jgi:hypothetical protein